MNRKFSATAVAQIIPHHEAKVVDLKPVADAVIDERNIDVTTIPNKLLKMLKVDQIVIDFNDEDNGVQYEYDDFTKVVRFNISRGTTKSELMDSIYDAIASRKPSIWRRIIMFIINIFSSSDSRLSKTVRLVLAGVEGILDLLEFDYRIFDGTIAPDLNTMK